MKKSSLDNNGFTLVEMIVVIVILAVLSSLALPAFITYIDEAKTQEDIINAKELMNAGQKVFDELYAEDELPNRPHNSYDTILTTGGDINWYSGFSKRFKECANLYTGKTQNPSTGFKYDENCPYLVALCVGSHRDNALTTNDPRVRKRAYTVYGIVYQRTPDSNAICFDGTQWITEMKGNSWPFYNNNKNMIRINGKEIMVTLYWINGFVPYGDISKSTNQIKTYGRAIGK